MTDIVFTAIKDAMADVTLASCIKDAIESNSEYVNASPMFVNNILSNKFGWSNDTIVNIDQAFKKVATLQCKTQNSQHEFNKQIKSIIFNTKVDRFVPENQLFLKSDPVLQRKINASIRLTHILLSSTIDSYIAEYHESVQSKIKCIEHARLHELVQVLPSDLRNIIYCYSIPPDSINSLWASSMIEENFGHARLLQKEFQNQTCAVSQQCYKELFLQVPNTSIDFLNHEIGLANFTRLSEVYMTRFIIGSLPNTLGGQQYFTMHIRPSLSSLLEISDRYFVHNNNMIGDHPYSYAMRQGKQYLFQYMYDKQFRIPQNTLLMLQREALIMNYFWFVRLYTPEIILYSEEKYKRLMPNILLRDKYNHVITQMLILSRPGEYNILAMWKFIEKAFQSRDTVAIDLCFSKFGSQILDLPLANRDLLLSWWSVIKFSQTVTLFKKQTDIKNEKPLVNSMSMLMSMSQQNILAEITEKEACHTINMILEWNEFKQTDKLLIFVKELNVHQLYDHYANIFHLLQAQLVIADSKKEKQIHVELTTITQQIKATVLGLSRAFGQSFKVSTQDTCRQLEDCFVSKYKKTDPSYVDFILPF